MMTAANVLEVSNWITELKLLMLTLHEYETTGSANIALVTPKQTRVLVPWFVAADALKQRAQFLVESCTAAGVDVDSLQAEISKHLPATVQSGG